MNFKRMHVIHTGDWHLGKNRKYHDYLTQQTYMVESILKQIQDALKELAPDEKLWFILGGDVFDRNEDTLRGEFVLFLAGFLLPLLALKEQYAEQFEFDIIDGNHDRQPNKDEPSVLSPLTTLTDRIQVVEPKFDAERGVLLIPFRDLSERELKELIRQYPAQFIVAHECLARMTTDIGYTPPRNQDRYLEINNIITDDIVAIFMDDIHKCQALDPGEKCWYSGSPTTLDHGHKLPKGLLHHYFVRSESGKWERDGRPELIGLNDPRIRLHYQLGILSDPEQIPHEAIRNLQAGSAYLQMVVTQQVYEKIQFEYPDFFRSPFVVYEIKGIAKEDDQSSVDYIEPDDLSGQTFAYYKGLIDEWFKQNTKDSSPEAREKSRQRIYRDFESRF